MISYSFGRTEYFHGTPVENHYEATDKAAKQACIILNSSLPHSDLKLEISFLIRNKWGRGWEGYTQNKLREIKLSIGICSIFTPRKIGIILTRLKLQVTHCTSSGWKACRTGDIPRGARNAPLTRVKGCHQKSILVL